ncbi:MAG TPA: hypothetical protein VMM18_16390 [Gemmatimonadaceae bacterium]|nr:hypothetical protein [Gemmatimonadaceae bacterium]
MRASDAIPEADTPFETESSDPSNGPSDPFIDRYLDGGRAIPWMTRGLLAAIATAAALFFASLVFAIETQAQEPPSPRHLHHVVIR